MKKLLFALFLLSSTLNVVANPTENSSLYNSIQKKKSKKKQQGSFDRTRLLLGPGFGFGAYNKGFSLNLSPSLAYCLTDNFHIGTTIGFNYFQQTVLAYNNISNTNQEYKYKIPTFDFSFFARYIIAQRILLSIEPQISTAKFISEPYAKSANKLTIDSKSQMISSVIGGVGYAQKFGQFAYSYLLITYDLTQNRNNRNYYGTIVPKAGVMISLFNR